MSDRNPTPVVLIKDVEVILHDRTIFLPAGLTGMWDNEVRTVVDGTGEIELYRFATEYNTVAYIRREEFALAKDAA